jgi:hypothetical protein
MKSQISKNVCTDWCDMPGLRFNFSIAFRFEIPIAAFLSGWFHLVPVPKKQIDG